MRKIGRNDRCPCGSGKKYRHCCLEQDKQSNITRIVRLDTEMNADASDENHSDDIFDEVETDAVSPFENADVETLLHTLQWDNPLYDNIAHSIFNHMQGDYDGDDIAAAILMWHAYCSIEKPIVRKTEVFIASIEYCIALINDDFEVTQAELAEKYGVSVTSISKRAGEIMELAEAVFGDEDLDEPDDWDEDDWDQVLHLWGDSHSDSNEGSPQEQAEDLVFEAIEANSSAKRVKLAKQAIEVFPDTPDAYSILAEYEATSPQAALERYEQGMLAGERVLGKTYFREHKGYFWGLIESRPYMRAKNGYANTLVELGRKEEASVHFEQMLELDPHDHIGVRYPLIGIYLERQQWDQAQRIIGEFKDEYSTYFAYDKMLIEYHAQKPSMNRLSKLWKQAKGVNPYVLDYVTGRKKLPPQQPDSFLEGDESEAICYAMDRLNHWKNAPELIDWLAVKR